MFTALGFFYSKKTQWTGARLRTGFRRVFGGTSAPLLRTVFALLLLKWVDYGKNTDAANEAIGYFYSLCEGGVSTNVASMGGV